MSTDVGNLMTKQSRETNESQHHHHLAHLQMVDKIRP